MSAITADFLRPVTTYHVTASDADGDYLHYKWSKAQGTPCGTFSAGDDSIATWSHPDKDFDPPGDCPNEDAHAAVISVQIKDAVGPGGPLNGWTCSAVYPGGSAEGTGEPATCKRAKPIGTVTPSGLEFRASKFGRTSDPQTVTLTNTGEPDSVLQVDSVEVYIPRGPGAFKISSNKCSSVDLRQGESCTVEVTFTADHYGTYSGIVIFVDDADPATQTAELDGTARPLTAGGGGGSGNTFGDGTKIVLKGIDKSANTTGNAIAVAAAVNAVVPLGFTQAFAVGLVITAAVLKLGGSVCGYLAEVVDPADAAYAHAVVATRRRFPHAKAGPGISAALAAAVNALAANTVALEADVHAYETALNRATGAAAAHKAKAAATQRRAAAAFADKAAAELLADPRLRAALAAQLHTVSVVLTAAQLAKARAAFAQNGLPASVASILQALGVSAADVAKLAKQPIPTRFALAVPTSSKWAKGEAAAAKALHAAARKLRAK